MLTPQLTKNIDGNWDKCWPVSSLKPLALLDLIAYVFFIKKLDDHRLITKKLAAASADQFIYTREIEEFSWSRLGDLTTQELHELFTKKNGVFDLMKLYGTTDSMFSQYFKVPPIVPPTPKLLWNVIQIINEIDSSDSETRSELAEYLFRKVEMIRQSGAEIIPEFVSKLIVSIAEPSPADIILDPSAGDGSLLINAANFLKLESSIHLVNYLNLTGMESGIVQLRMAAMRMILHGIKTPSLKVFSSPAVEITEKPSLIISNLLFTNIDADLRNDPVPDVGKELFLLNHILEQLQPGARAVILVPEMVLKNKNPEMVIMRQNIVENFHLEGVINLPPVSHSLFSSAGILIFNKARAAEKVWFCKMEKIRKTRTVNETFKNEKTEWLVSSQSHEINYILNKWRNRAASPENKAENSFYISAYDIKENQYNLNFNDYKLIVTPTETESELPVEIPIIAGRNENLRSFYESSVPLVEKKRKRRFLPAAIFLIILVSAVFFYFYNLNGRNIVKDLTDGFFNEPKSNTLPDKKREDSSRLLNKNTSTSQTLNTISHEVSQDAFTDSSATAKAEADTASDPSVNPKSHSYRVLTKTWFYRTPDSSNQRQLFLEPRPDLLLNPTNEENGFVYVVYVNKKGEATRGWLNKKDLQMVQ